MADRRVENNLCPLSTTILLLGIAVYRVVAKQTRQLQLEPSRSAKGN